MNRFALFAAAALLSACTAPQHQYQPAAAVQPTSSMPTTSGNGLLDELRYTPPGAPAAAVNSMSLSSGELVSAPTVPTMKEPQWYRVQATASQISRAKKIIARAMKDPMSAQFRDMYAITRGTGDDTVCGEVNAKNSYGGYVGFRLFYVDSAGIYAVSEPEDIKYKYASPDLLEDLPALKSLPVLVCDKPRKP